MERIKKLAESLHKKGYIVNCFETKEEAAAFMNLEIDQTTVGIGGSETVVQMGLYPLLASHNTVYWHHEKPDGMTVAETRHAACAAQVYISSVNGASEDGILINIDHTGNRVAALNFGPDKAFLVIGKNKIEENEERAMFRARNVAAPLNAKRLNRKTPCAVNGDRCYDCKSPDRICRIFSVMREMPKGIEYHVILINENLGF